MEFLVLALTLAAGASAAPQTYGIPSAYGAKLAVTGCRDGMVLKVDGTCEFPSVTRTVFVFSAPDQPKVYAPPPRIPKPKVDTNVLVIRAPEPPPKPDPIIVPSAQQENIVYVLSKTTQPQQQVIEVPSPDPLPPQVYFVDVEDDDVNAAIGNAGGAGGFAAGGGAGGFAAGGGAGGFAAGGGAGGFAAGGGAGGFAAGGGGAGGLGLGGLGLGGLGLGAVGGAGVGGGNVGGASGYGGGLAPATGVVVGGPGDNSIFAGGAGVSGGPQPIGPVAPSSVYSAP
ncbi:uncharacterized protein [Panulirus ornatus]|uniref:uncharacterized protein n=1 Tax=Panulirus ornatus TaxID=150431 RepID=UPI003A87147C